MEFDTLSDRVGGRVSEAVEGLRDRTADALSTDGVSVIRELAAIRDRIDELDDALDDRLAAVAADVAAGRGSKRTTTPRKLFWIAFGAAAGALAAYLADPDRGRSRRAQLSDQVAARGREVAEEAANRAKYTAGKVKGELIEGAKELRGDDVPEDPKLLEQRIRSEVLGHRDDVTDVVLRVDGPGRVTVKGTVPSATSERELLAAVADVDGVIDVASELSVGSSS